MYEYYKNSFWGYNRFTHYRRWDLGFLTSIKPMADKYDMIHKERLDRQEWIGWKGWYARRMGRWGGKEYNWPARAGLGEKSLARAATRVQNIMASKSARSRSSVKCSPSNILIVTDLLTFKIWSMQFTNPSNKVTFLFPFLYLKS